MVRPVAGDLPEQVKNNQSVNMAAGNGGQKMSQYPWFTVYCRKETCTVDIRNGKIRAICRSNLHILRESLLFQQPSGYAPCYIPAQSVSLAANSLLE